MTQEANAPLESEIREIFSREFEDGNVKRGSIFWTHNGRNVGSDVLTAAVEAKDCLRAGWPASLTLKEAIARLATAHERYRRGYEDEDGYGSATFHEIRRRFDALAARHGADAAFNPATV